MVWRWGIFKKIEVVLGLGYSSTTSQEKERKKVPALTKKKDDVFSRSFAEDVPEEEGGARGGQEVE